MKNFVQNGDYLTIVAPYAVTSGGGCMVETLFGVAVTDIANGASGVIATEGVFTLDKNASDGGIAVYGDVYWDAATKKVTGESSGNQLIGTAMLVALDAATTAVVRLGIKIAPSAQLFLPVNFLALANGTNVDQVIYVATDACTVTAISEIHATPGDHGSDVTGTIRRCQDTEAVTAGDDLLGATKFNFKGTANTVQTPALTDTVAHLALAVGDRLAIDYTGDIATLAGVAVTVTLRID